jgi:hypothetical protein
MQNLTPDGQQLVNNICARYGLSPNSAVHMIIAVNNGGGTMAQFSCPELGSGQWMQGGMTMVSDMFNYSLKTTVINLCEEISNALATTRVFPPSQGGFGLGNSWWPAELGNPSSSGGQNDSRYAVFPHLRRLAIQSNGQVTVYDTLDNNIGGVGQQQGGSDSLTFSSQYGTIRVDSLPRVSGPGLNVPPQTNFVAPPPAPAPYFESPQAQQSPQGPASFPSQNVPQNSSDILTLLEKLGQLRDAGILTPDEFSAKKAELLGRL